MTDFIGAKAALVLHDNQLVVIQRDDKPGLRDAGLWECPGGGREGHETPFECVAREVKEELSIDLREANVLWQRAYPSVIDPTKLAYFLVVRVSVDDVASITLGDEGQGWKLMSMSDFLAEPTTVPLQKAKLHDYLARRR